MTVEGDDPKITDIEWLDLCSFDNGTWCGLLSNWAREAVGSGVERA